MTQQLQTLIDNAWENRASMSPAAAPKEVIDAVEHVRGLVTRVEPFDGEQHLAVAGVQIAHSRLPR